MIYYVECRIAIFEQKTILIFNRPPIKAAGGTYAFFLTFWCLQYAYLDHFWWEIIFDLENLSFFFEIQQALVFSGQVSLVTIAELLKNPSVFLKRLRTPRLWWEQY